jgi:hypothetical protein
MWVSLKIPNTICGARGEAPDKLPTTADAPSASINLRRENSVLEISVQCSVIRVELCQMRYYLAMYKNAIYLYFRATSHVERKMISSTHEDAELLFS